MDDLFELLLPATRFLRFRLGNEVALRAGVVELVVVVIVVVVVVEPSDGELSEEVTDWSVE